MHEGRKKCSKQDCESTDNVLLHGAIRIFSTKEKTPCNSHEPKLKHVKKVSSHAAVERKITKTATDGVSSDSSSVQTLVPYDGVSTHSWVFAFFAIHLKLVGEPIHTSISGLKAINVLGTQQLKFNVSSEPNKANLSFTMEAYVKDNIHIGTECINMPELQVKYPLLAHTKPLQYNYEEIEVIVGHDYYHTVRPIELLLGEESNSPCRVRLPILWVITGLLALSAGLTSSCCNFLMKFRL